VTTIRGRAEIVGVRQHSDRFYKRYDDEEVPSELEFDFPDRLSVCANGVDGFQTNDPINLLCISVLAYIIPRNLQDNRVVCHKTCALHQE
jgi:hypothetical protein